MVNQTHSMRRLKDAITEVGGRGRRVVDKRTALGKSLMRWRGELVADLGGQEALSTQQNALVDIAVRGKGWRGWLRFHRARTMPANDRQRSRFLLPRAWTPRMTMTPDLVGGLITPMVSS